MEKTTSMDDFIKMYNEPEKLVGKIPGTYASEFLYFSDFVASPGNGVLLNTI